MGGFVRAIAKAVFGTPKQQAPVQVVQEPKKTVTEPSATQLAKEQAMTKSKLMGAGYGGTTIMSSASGVEEEAETAKTVLGGAKKKMKA